MPRCPVCKTQADPIDYEGMRIYNCGQCGGHWLTQARLDVILDRRQLEMPEPVKQRMMDIADAADSKQTLWCMSCGKEMIKERFRYWDEIQIDRCPKCQGLWLDRGELEKCQIYWEYAQDHPEEWENSELIERKALLEAEFARRKQDRAQRRREIGRRSRYTRGLGLGGSWTGSMLGSMFGR